jgi:hypothetical protein
MPPHLVCERAVDGAGYVFGVKVERDLLTCFAVFAVVDVSVVVYGFRQEVGQVIPYVV